MYLTQACHATRRVPSETGTMEEIGMSNVHHAFQSAGSLQVGTFAPSDNELNNIALLVCRVHRSPL